MNRRGPANVFALVVDRCLAVLAAIVLAAGCSAGPSVVAHRNSPTASASRSPVKPTAQPGPQGHPSHVALARSPQQLPIFSLKAGRAVSCSRGMPLRSGHSVRQVASLDRVRATFTARAGRREFGYRDLRLLVKTPNQRSRQVRLVVPHDLVYPSPGSILLGPVDPAGRGAVCLGRVLGGQVVAVVGVEMGNNCCSGAAVVPITGAGAGKPAWFDSAGDYVALATLAGRARLVSGNWFGCTDFWPCAGGGTALLIADLNGTTRTDVTKDFPRLLRADARYWRSSISRTHPVNTSGSIAPWIADECRVGREQAAWRWLNEQLRDGRLQGNRYQPGGKRLVAFLHNLLDQEDLCSD